MENYENDKKIFNVKWAIRSLHPLSPCSSSSSSSSHFSLLLNKQLIKLFRRRRFLVFQQFVTPYTPLFHFFSLHIYKYFLVQAHFSPSLSLFLSQKFFNLLLIKLHRMIWKERGSVKSKEVLPCFDLFAGTSPQKKATER